MITTPDGPLPVWAVFAMPPLAIAFLVLLGVAIRGIAADARNRRGGNRR